MADFRTHRCWIVTDKARRNAQARRLDGKPFDGPDGHPLKAWTLPGSEASLPIGLLEVQQYANVLLVEGGPDLLAAYHFIEAERRANDCHVVALLGASHRIPPSCIGAFRGIQVRLFPHYDESGRRAAAHWSRALRGVGARVDGVNFDGLRQADGKPVKDLNDLCFSDPDEFEMQRELWNLCPANNS
jgi:hypothetical protein